MSKFHEIQFYFSDLIENFGFAPLYALWPNDSIILCHAIGNQENIFCYILASANKDGSLRTDLWISPLNQPDSTLNSNCGAFQVPVGITYEDDADFFIKCNQRILKMIPDVYSLSTASKKELADPSLISTTPVSPNRMKILNYYIEGINCLKKNPHYAETIEMTAENVYNKKSTSLSTIIKAVKNMPSSVYDTCTKEASTFLRTARTPPFDTHSIMAEYCYIDTATQIASKYQAAKK